MKANKHKIIFVLPSFSAGGAERVLISLMNGLNREKFSPEFICLKKGGSLRSLIAPDTPVHAPFNFPKVMFSLSYLWWMIWRLQPDTVISTMAHMNFALLIVRFFLPRRIKFIVREAITPSYMRGMTRYPALIEWLYRVLYPSADIVICPAQLIIDEFKTLTGLKPKRFQLLYNPVQLDRIRAHLPASAHNHIRHFICAGRLHPQKGYARLISALADAAFAFEWRLDIWGDGDEHDALQKLIQEKGLNHRVFLRGFTNQPWPEMAQADAFLLPSLYEGLPNVALESLAVGTTVIAMESAGGIAEIASAVSPGHVVVCPHMNDFVYAMAQTVKKKNYGENLLPRRFHPDHVLSEFEKILN
ncbi:MAG: glycosyltransferase [Alphaproteobacteria bacterium]|nr:glycosyltransferase [Alphaproteobacteria bacterium]